MANIQDGSATFKIMDIREESFKKAMVDLIYPVGIVIAIANDNKPAFMNYGKWKKVAPDRVLWGAGKHTPGTIIAAGLPNITGTFPNGNESNKFVPTGAFYKTTETTTSAYDGTAYPNLIGMDASKCSPIYGNSDTVQPDAYVVTYWQRTE